jgi:hypothetical protein
VRAGSIKAAVVCALLSATSSLFNFIIQQPKYHSLIKDLEQTLNDVLAAEQDAKNDLDEIDDPEYPTAPTLPMLAVIISNSTIWVSRECKNELKERTEKLMV